MNGVPERPQSFKKKSFYGSTKKDPAIKGHDRKHPCHLWFGVITKESVETMVLPKEMKGCTLPVSRTDKQELLFYGPKIKAMYRPFKESIIFFIIKRKKNGYNY